MLQNAQARSSRSGGRPIQSENLAAGGSAGAAVGPASLAKLTLADFFGALRGGVLGAGSTSAGAAATAAGGTAAAEPLASDVADAGRLRQTRGFASTQSDRPRE